MTMNESQSESFADRVLAQLLAEREATLGRYLVIDQAALQSINVPAELGWPNAGHDLLTRRAVDWAAGASPVLLQAPALARLPSHHQLRWLQLARRWRQSNAIAYVESTWPAPQLAAALAARMHVSLEGDLRVVLRWFDARVFRAMATVLTHEQWAAFLAPASQWVTMTREGGSTAWGHVQAANPGPQPSAWTLKLTQQQEDALVEQGEVDALADALLKQGHAVALALEPADRHQRLSERLATAKARALSQRPDQLVYCAAGLESGPAFDQGEPWAGWIARAKAQQRPLADIVAEGAAE